MERRLGEIMRDLHLLDWGLRPGRGRTMIHRAVRPAGGEDCGSSGRHWLSDKADGFGVFEPGLDRGDDGAKLDREQFDAHEGDSHEGVDDDALVEDAVDHFGEA